MTLDECLPAALRGPTTTITRVGGGQSGAGVYRVEAAGDRFVLKVAGEETSPSAWRCALELQRLAAGAGIAPAVVHVDEERRAIVSAFVVDRSFAAFCGHPATRAAAVDLVGRTLRRLHALPSPDVAARDLRALLTTIWSTLSAGPALPGFVADAVGRVLAETPPPADRAPVFSHNDVNPSNLAYDGARLMLLDWDTAGANDPYHDLATIAVFLRMDDAACAQLFTAYDGAAPPSLPPRFCYLRRLVAGACGAILLQLARLAGHDGARGDETLATAPSLAEVHARMRGGGFDLAGGDARWTFGLALLKESLAR